jgi:hypothetical protein
MGIAIADSKKRRWPGLVPMFRSFIYGAGTPKTSLCDSPSQTASTAYASMDTNYRWFRKDRLVRRCVLVNGFFSTLAAGFDTVLQATDKSLEESAQKALIKKYADVKVKIDDLNKKLDMDRVLFITQVKRSIFGRSGWEIIMEGSDDEEGTYPAWLLSLRSEKLKPKQDKKTWELQGYSYGNVRVLKYNPEDVFYVTNLQLEHDYMGLSDIEPITEACNARNEVIWENFPEIVRTLWAPVHIASADTKGMSDAAETAFLNNLGIMLRAGKAIAVNKAIDLKTIALNADIGGLAVILKELKEEVIGNFGTPRFLLGQPIENRATAYAELEAYIEGPITAIQNELARFMEAWYDRWARVYLEHDADAKFKPTEDNGKLPVEIKHVWRPNRVTDIYEAAKAAAALWGPGGMGPLGLNPDIGLRKVWELLEWDPTELEELQEEAPE